MTEGVDTAQLGGQALHRVVFGAEEVQARVDGHVATGESSTTTGGAARSTSKAPPPPESDANSMDEPNYGVGAQDWPTEAQISRQNAQDKAAWRRTLTARGG